MKHKSSFSLHKSSENVFKKFNWWPFEHECRYAQELIKGQQHQTGSSSSCGSSSSSSSSSNDNNVENTEITQPPDDLNSEQVGDEAEKLWKASLANNRKHPSLFRCLMRCLAWDYLVGIVLCIFTRLILILMLIEFVRKMLLKIEEFDVLEWQQSTQSDTTTSVFQQQNNSSQLQLISNTSLHHHIGPTEVTATPPDSITRDEDEYRAIVYEEIALLALQAFVCVTAHITLTSVCEFLFQRCGLKCRIVLTQLIRRKSLRVHLATSIRDSSNRAMGLITNEVTRVEDANRELMFLFSGPLALILATVWLALTQTSWKPAVLTVPFVATCILIQIYLQKVYKRMSQRRTKETNKRLDIINTALSSMKVVKLYAWESQFTNKVKSHRDAEMSQIKLLDRFAILDTLLFGALNRIIPSIVFLGNLLIAGKLDEQVIFTSTIVFNIWRSDGLYYFPRSIRSISDVITACENIKQYLMLDEFRDQRKETLHDDAIGGTRIRCKDLHVSIRQAEVESQETLGSGRRNDRGGSVDGPGIATTISTIPTITATATTTTTIIDNLDMQLESGDLVFVIGPVGSGKSSLLFTLLGETRITGGQLTVSKGTRFAYASQEACLFPDTLRNNIINGRPFESDRYNQVLDICSLRRDLKQLPNSDQTLVGSKGVALSGGQKARLSLARAIYSQADVYLLDDPLSALDGKVAKEIFTNCVCKFLAEKLVVLVTHQVQFLESAKKVIIMNRHSRPIFGLTQEVMQREDCRKILDEFKRSASAQGDVTPDQTIEAGKQDQKKLQQAKMKDKLRNDRSLGTRLGQNNGSSKRSSVYWYFTRLGFSNKGIVLLIICLIGHIALCSVSEYSLYVWSSNMESQKYQAMASSSSPQQQDSTQNQVDRDFMIKQWILFMATFIVYFTYFWFAVLVVVRGFRRATGRLHERMINSLFQAKMSFYDFCQTGDLSSRYAGDFAIIDLSMIHVVLRVIFDGIIIITSIIPIIVIDFTLGIPFVLMSIILIPWTRIRYKDSRKIMDLNKSLRSPMFTSLTWAIDELTTVRSEPDHLSSAVKQFNRNQNRWTSLTLLYYSYNAHLIIMIKLAMTLINSSVFLMIFGLYGQELKVCSAGTLLVLILQMSSLLPTTLEVGSVFEANMMSVDSIRTLTELEPEEGRPPAVKGRGVDLKPPEALKWTVGKVCFRSVTMRYFEDEKPAIEGLSFVTGGGERVGVVGRTGAGKSSILSALYRLYPFEGSILIDNVDIKSLELGQLRSSLGIIPQDPVLFSDSLRKNLDPSGQFSDEQLWRALEVVNLKQVVLNDLSEKLEQQISEGGRNFSVGQRQLICLARAVLRSPKILLIDEATANVDSETDAFIQRTIRNHFVSTTIITIAHRLNTILDYDRVMVLDSGRIVEFDTVERLLELKGGVFRSMMNQTTMLTSG